MRDGLIEETRYLRNPLDVLAQQIVAHCAMETPRWTTWRRSSAGRRPFTELSDDVLASVLELLSGRYPPRSSAS